jgi:hypothetical protein
VIKSIEPLPLLFKGRGRGRVQNNNKWKYRAFETASYLSAFLLAPVAGVLTDSWNKRFNNLEYHATI